MRSDQEIPVINEWRKKERKRKDKERKEAEKEGDREIMLEGKERQKTKRTEASCRDWKKKIQ